MNPSDSAGQRFFGLDTSQWPGQWRAAASLVLDWPLLRRLVPEAPLRLHQADGSSSAWVLLRGVARPLAGELPRDAAHAVELAPDHVLERRLTLPALAPADLARAVELEATSASPFPADQTVWGHAAERSDDGLVHVRLAMTSRSYIEQVLQAAILPPGVQAEVWVLPTHRAAGAAMHPVVLRGWGETRREQRVQHGLRQRLLVLLVLLVLLAGLVVTPTVFMRAKARQAAQAFSALQAQAGEQIAEREVLMLRLERLQQVAGQLERQLALPPVLDMLTRTLPDGAWLTALRVDGARLTLNGQADDAAALVQALASQPGAHDVRLASPATRRAGAAKETFIIELQLDAEHYGHSRPAPEPALAAGMQALHPSLQDDGTLPDSGPSSVVQDEEQRP